MPAEDDQCMHCQGLGSVQGENPFRYLDKVSWSVGSDVYVGVVTGVDKRAVHVEPRGGRQTIVFTRRGDAAYRLAGSRSITLTLGGKAYLDPHF